MSKPEGKGDVIKAAKPFNKGSSITSSKQPTPKRPNSEVSPNSSVEELSIMHHTLDGLTVDVKDMRDNLKNILTKSEMQELIHSTIKTTISDIYENMELTISLKVEEKTKEISQKLTNVQSENEALRKDIITLKSQMKAQSKKIEDSENTAKDSLRKANYNEQYSRKNNIKVMDMPMTKPNETEADLISEVSSLFNKEGITVDPSKVIAIHRIPGKTGHAKPILIKFMNNNEKSKIMTHRTAFKTMGRRLVDDVTKLNAQLITRLSEHPKIQQAWYFNGSVFGKTTDDIRHKFDLHDNIDAVIKK